MYASLLAAPPAASTHRTPTAAAHHHDNGQLPGPHRTPSTAAEWSADLRRRWGLAVVGTPTLVPVRLLATAGADVLVFTGTGTTLRLQLFDEDALRQVPLTSDCDCGVPHLDPYGVAPERKTILDPWASPRREVVRDGSALFGWTGVKAAMLPVPAAAGHLESMLLDL